MYSYSPFRLTKSHIAEQYFAIMTRMSAPDLLRDDDTPEVVNQAHDACYNYLLTLFFAVLTL